MDSSSSSSDSDGEFIAAVLQVMPRPRLFRERENLLEKYDNIDFKNRFRFNKESVMHLLEIVGPALERHTNRSMPIPALAQLLITLRFYATGTFQKVLGDHVNVSQPTVCRIIPIVTNAIAELGHRFIKMPDTLDEQRKSMSEYYNIRQFPCVIGAIDCTHIRIQSPGGANAELYRNRKGWFSYNVQAVCDANLKFTNLIARWPGSVHDSTVFYDSPLRVEFESGDYPNCYLLGDAGYACKPYLLTPVNNPISPADQRYNEAQIHTRNCIDRAFGVWKRRFPCLSLGMRLKKQTVLHVIVATAVLHNASIDLRDNEPADIELVENTVDMVQIDQANRVNNFAVRDALIARVFNIQQ